MSTFMGFACVDLRAGADAGRFVAAFDTAFQQEPDGKSLMGRVDDRDGRARVSLIAHYGNIWLDSALCRAAAATGDVARAVVGLDHDEYGIENVVLDGGDGLRRVHHVYVYPGGAVIDEYRPSGPLAGLPVAGGGEVRPDGTVDGPRARAAAAALFGVPPERMEQAARRSANAHQDLGSVFTPFEAWWDALGAVYPVEQGDPSFVLVEFEPPRWL